MPCGVGGVPTGAGLVDGRPRALIPGEGVREGLGGERLGAGTEQISQVQERSGKGWLGGRGAGARASVAGG